MTAVARALLTSTPLASTIVLVVALAVLASSLGCRGENAAAEQEILPGRSRPVLRHDWPHPRDFRFQPSRFTPPDPAKTLTKSSSGLRAYVVASTTGRTVRLTAALPLGRLYEQPGEAGASGFVAQSLRKSLGAAWASDVVGDLRLQERADVTIVTVEVLPEDWQPALVLLVNGLRGLEPDPNALTTYRTSVGYFRQTARIDDGGAFRPRVELERRLGGYPLAPPDPDQPVSIDGVRALISRSLAPNVIVLGIGGHVEAAAVQSTLEKLSGSWQPAKTAPRLAAMPTVSASERFSAIDSPTLEGWIAIGKVIPPVPAAERPPLAVAADILNVRLNIAAREIRGLANRASFELADQADGSGLVRIVTGGRAEAVAPLVKVCLDEVRRIHSPQDVISDDELQRAKGSIVLSAWQASLDGAENASATFAVETVRSGGTQELMAWPSAVDAVSRESVRAAITKYLDPRDMTTVVVGPLDRIKVARHPRWPATLDEVSGTQ